MPIRLSNNPLQTAHFLQYVLLAMISAVLFQVRFVVSVVVPRTGCYGFDNSSHIYDFSSWIGYPFEYDGKDVDLVVRFCKDVETRSQSGYVAFGRFDRLNYFSTGPEKYNFLQEYSNGDLANCEKSFDKMGRTAQVNIICGNCPNQQCKGGLGCICNVVFHSACRVVVELAIPCEKKGPRVLEGFTVGFHPRSWEIVDNGLTQLGFEKGYKEFSFKTEQSQVALYMTAVASLSNLVQKPIVKVFPEKGLDVKLSGSAVTGDLPTTLSPSVLLVDWRCDRTRNIPYEVAITVPVGSYDPIQFTLTKICEYRQSVDGSATRGWALFGVLSCVCIVFFTLFCCGGFVYKTRVQNQHGLDALPGMTILSACLETVSGVGHGYTRADDVGGTFVHQASWERHPTTGGTSRSSEVKYGSI